MPVLSWTEATFWIAAVACLVAQAAIVRSVLVAGRSPSAAPEGAEAAAVRFPRRPAEVAWAVVPALALAGVLFMTWQAVRA